MPTNDTPPDADITAQLEKARRELLDLGARNRLIHTPRSKTRTTRLDIVDELSEQVFRLLVTGVGRGRFTKTPTQDVLRRANI